jgi:hypothetical protein
MPLRGSILTLAERSRTLSGQVAQLVLDEKAQQIVQAARGPWPASRSRNADNVVSRERLMWERGTSTKVQIRIINTAETRKGVRYVPLILSKGVRPWQAYIVEPTLQMARTVGPEIARRISAALAVR